VGGFPRTEWGCDKTVRFKGLVHRRRLMEAARNGFEIVDGKPPGVVESVPSYKVEGVRAIHVRINKTLLLDQNPEISLFRMGLKIVGPFDIPFTVGGVFGQLAVGVPVPRGGACRAR